MAQGRWLLAVVWGQPLWQHPAAQEEQRPWVGQVSMCSWLQSSWKGWSTTDTPEPAAKLQRGTHSDWHCPVPPVQG